MITQRVSTRSVEIEDDMQKRLLLLRKNNADKDEIKKSQKAYLSEIKKEQRLEKREIQQVHAFLKILNKENCVITENLIRKHFFTFRSTTRTWSTPLLRVKAIWAMQALAREYLVKAALQMDEYQARRKKLFKLKKALAEVAVLMEDPDVGDYYTRKAEQDEEVSTVTILGDHFAFYRQVCRRGRELYFNLVPEKEKGRPADKDFYSFVYHVAKTYEEVSGIKFTLDKHKATHGADAGQYIATTPGHKFVCEAVAWMHREFPDPDIKAPLEYTSVNIYQACEKARKALGKK